MARQAGLIRRRLKAMAGQAGYFLPFRKKGKKNHPLTGRKMFRHDLSMDETVRINALNTLLRVFPATRDLFHHFRPGSDEEEKSS